MPKKKKAIITIAILIVLIVIGYFLYTFIYDDDIDRISKKINIESYNDYFDKYSLKLVSKRFNDCSDNEKIFVIKKASETDDVILKLVACRYLSQNDFLKNNLDVYKSFLYSDNDYIVLEAIYNCKNISKDIANSLLLEYLKKEKIIGSVQVLLEYNSNKNIIRKLLWILQKKAIQVYKNLITVSNFGKNEIKKNVNGKFNIKVIYPGIEIQKAKKHKPEKFKIIKKKYILYLGRLDYIPKGLDILLKAMQNVKSDIALVIAGNGKKNDIQNINNDIKKFNLGERVILTGGVYNDEKSYLINNCLALCLPSRNEQMPLTIFEAFYFSKPVICSKIGGMIEIITKSKGGLFFENDNDKDLANKLKILINNRKLREKLGKSGNKYIKSFTWDLCAINTYEFYKSIYNE